MSEGFVRIGRLSDFPAGSMKKVRVNGKDVLVANIAGGLYAIDDECTHRGCSLSEGTIEEDTVVCPCHAGRFNVKTGKVVAAPPKKDAASFEVRLEGSDVLLRKR